MTSFQGRRRSIVLRFTLALTALGAMALGLKSSKAEDFYAGKTITIVVDGGGAYAAYARILAHIMPAHIPGRPTMIVQEVPGGGGIRAANYVNNVVPKDGTVIAGTHGAVLTAPLLSPDVVEFDPTKFGWIGNVTRDTYLVYVWRTAPIRSLEEAARKQVVMGGTSVGGEGIDMAIFARDLLGWKIKIVSGYKTSSETKLAMEKGEIDGTMGNAVSDLKLTDWLQTGKVRILAQHGNKRDPEFLNVPLFRDFVPKEYRRMYDFLGIRDEIAKPYFAPPGIPQQRLAVLRQAFKASLKDPEFIAEVNRQHLEFRDPRNGEELIDIAVKAAATPPPVVKQLVDLFKNYRDGR